MVCKATVIADEADNAQVENLAAPKRENYELA